MENKIRKKRSNNSVIKYKLELLNCITHRAIHTQLFARLEDICELLDLNYQQVQRVKYGTNRRMKPFIKITNIND